MDIKTVMIVGAGQMDRALHRYARRQGIKCI